MLSVTARNTMLNTREALTAGCSASVDRFSIPESILPAGGYGNTPGSQSIAVSFDPVLWRRARISAVLELTSGREVVIEIVIIVNAGRYRKSCTNSRSLGAVPNYRGKICLELVSPYFNADLYRNRQSFAFALVGPPHCSRVKSRSRLREDAISRHSTFPTFLSLSFSFSPHTLRRRRRLRGRRSSVVFHSAWRRDAILRDESLSAK
jgi:hypothetical protein